MNIICILSQVLANMFQYLGGLRAISPIKVITEPVVKIIQRVTGDYSGILVLILSLILLFFTLRYLVMEQAVEASYEMLIDDWEMFKEAVKSLRENNIAEIGINIEKTEETISRNFGVLIHALKESDETQAKNLL